MSVDTKDPGGELEDVSDVKPEVDKGSKAGGKDSVSHETYKKTVSEVKRLKDQLREAQGLKDKLTELEQNEQMRQGKHEETIATLRADLEKVKKSEKAVYQKYAFKSLSQQVREEATKQGCVDPEALMKLADVGDVEIDAETFEADKEKLVEIVSQVKTARPYLFNKSGPKVNGSLPSGDKVSDKKMLDFKKMTAGEITDWLNKNR
jgi:hypothetical protein